VCAREALSGCSGGSGVGDAGGGEERRGTLGKTPLRRVTPGPLFLWPIYRLLLLALCYYCYQVLFAPPPRRSPPPPLLCRRRRPFRLIAYNVELFIAHQLCVRNIPSAVLCRTTLPVVGYQYDRVLWRPTVHYNNIRYFIHFSSFHQPILYYKRYIILLLGMYAICFYYQFNYIFRLLFNN